MDKKWVPLVPSGVQYYVPGPLKDSGRAGIWLKVDKSLGIVPCLENGDMIDGVASMDLSISHSSLATLKLCVYVCGFVEERAGGMSGVSVERFLDLEAGKGHTAGE